MRMNRWEKTTTVLLVATLALIGLHAYEQREETKERVLAWENELERDAVAKKLAAEYLGKFDGIIGATERNTEQIVNMKNELLAALHERAGERRQP